MKPYAFLCFSGLLLVRSLSGAELSDTNNGVYVAIGGSSTNDLVDFDERIVWRPFCNTGAVELNYPDPSYGVRIRMTGPDGNEVSKTALGLSFGTKFDKVQRFEDTTGGVGAGYHSSHTGVISAHGNYDERDSALTGPLLPSPKQLFQMGTPGIYVMEIQLQMFQVAKGTNLWTRQLIQFAPIKIRVKKPAL
jgi:hypothetical protein